MASEVRARGALLRAGFLLALCTWAVVSACGGTFTGSDKRERDAGQTDAGQTGGGQSDGPGTVSSGNRFVDSINWRSVEKIDLLVMVDNSLAMADKQSIFAEALPELVQRFTNPLCADVATGVGDRSKTPADPSAACPTG